MKNFQNLLLQDVQQHLHSFKFVVVLVFACLISGVCVCINILDFNDRQNNYQTEVTRNQDQMKSFRSFGDFKVLIQVPPNPLAIFAKGVENEVGNKVVIEPMEIPLPKKTSEATNPFLAIFSYMDITGIVGLILSLLVLLITTDVISGDKEKHLLKMIFANSVSRTEYLTSKYLGAFLISTDFDFRYDCSDVRFVSFRSAQYFFLVGRTVYLWCLFTVFIYLRFIRLTDIGLLCFKRIFSNKRTAFMVYSGYTLSGSNQLHCNILYSKAFGITIGRRDCPY